MPAGANRARTAPAATPDEAQQPEVIEATIVEPDESTPKTAAFMATMEVMRKAIISQVNAATDSKVTALQQGLDDLAAILETLQGGPADDADTGDDYLGDKLDDLRSDVDEIRGTVGALTDGRVTPQDVARETRSVVDEVRAEFENRLNSVAKSLGEQVATGLHTELPGIAERVVTAATGVPAVYRQVAALMLEVDEISKNGRASYGSGAGAANYAFRGVDDAMNAVGGAMRKVGLIMRTEVTNAESDHYDTTKVYNGKETTTRWTTTRITMRYIFVSPIDGTEHALEGYGVGKDSADKDGSKALAAAMKYALFQGLVIPVKGMNIDPESDNPDSGAEEHNRPQGGQYVPEQPYDDGPPADADEAVPAQQRRPANPDEPTRDPADPEFDKAYWAQRALTALRAAPNRKALNVIANGARTMGITGVELEGRSIFEHINSIKHTIPEA